MKNPYEYSAMTKLMQRFYAMGWYSGTLDLLTITMQGGFEAFSGRACETWEHRFVVRNCEIPELKIKAHEAHGNTLDEACERLLAVLGDEG